MSGWLSIATAPKDGTRFIALMVSGDIEKVHWCDHYEPHGWAAEACGYLPVITHWMPLPALPVEADS